MFRRLARVPLIHAREIRVNGAVRMNSGGRYKTGTEEELDPSSSEFMSKVDGLIKANPHVWEMVKDFQETLMKKGKLDINTLSDDSLHSDPSRLETLRQEWSEDPEISEKMKAVQDAMNTNSVPLDKLQDLKNDIESIRSRNKPQDSD